MQIKNQQVILPVLSQKKITLHIKRDDLTHPLISGNKYRKLKYNLIEAKNRDLKTLVTFGGAYSNHVAAVAYAGKHHGFKTFGIIRGEEIRLTWKDNPTLKLAHEHGMQFVFVSREAYRDKVAIIEELKKKISPFYLLPEGGTNDVAILGCQEILTNADSEYNFITAAVGTGGTISGIINSTLENQYVLGFPALKGSFLKEDIRKFAKKSNWDLQNEYHFGGYGKVSSELVTFINEFKEKTKIPLDPIYTGKMIFGLMDMIRKDYFKPETKILAIHTGGLQGIHGMNLLLKKKGLPLISV